MKRQQRKRKTRGARDAMRFPEVAGKTVDWVELRSSLDYHGVSILFRDQTMLEFELEPGLTVAPSLSDWKTHEMHIMKKWPPVRSAARLETRRNRM